MSLVAEAFVSQIAGSPRGRRRDGGGGGGHPRGERAGVSLQPWVEGAEPTARVETAMEVWPHFPDEETEDTRPRSLWRGRVQSTLPPRCFVPRPGDLGVRRRPGVGIEVGAWPQVPSSPPLRLLWECGSLSGLRFSSLR